MHLLFCLLQTKVQSENRLHQTRYLLDATCQVASLSTTFFYLCLLLSRLRTRSTLKISGIANAALVNVRYVSGFTLFYKRVHRS